MKAARKFNVSALPGLLAVGFAAGSLALAGAVGAGAPPASAAPAPAGPQTQAIKRMPWHEAGLTERQAAAHLLNRFAFGPLPGEIDQVIATGLDKWFEDQLAARLPDANLEARLRDLPALSLSEADIVRVYRNPGQVLAEALKEGIVTKDEVAAAKADKVLQNLFRKGGGAEAGMPGAAAAPWGAMPAGGVLPASGASAEPPNGLEDMERSALRAKLLDFARRRGYRPERELVAQLQAQKLLRAAESRNQMREVMTDFWFNHFNVSQTNGQARPYLLSYERDAIRPNALGTVRGLLEATARHPAMLYYLNNAESTAAPDAPTLLGDEMSAMAVRRGPLAKPVKRPKGRGLNENYARELMELHTLGVDGGYTQKDVIEVARAFTGWTVLPAGPGREAAEKRLERVRQYGGLGFHSDGDFLFRADMHDDGPKVILGYRLPAGRGIEDGETVLDLLAANPATARHLSEQLAVRFVSDHPPQALVDRLVTTCNRSRGDVRAMLRTLVESREFWSPQAVGAKVKSPFELAVSAVRESGAHVEDPRQLLAWVARMGEPLYAYQAPTGYPDRGDAWVNTGSLLNRMNFGLQFATQRIAGFDVDLPSLHDGHEPESREQALGTYAALLLPGRDLGTTIKLLTPLISDPDVGHRVEAAAPAPAAAVSPAVAAVAAPAGTDEMQSPNPRPARQGAGGGGGGGGRVRQAEVVRAVQPRHPPTAIEQVVGLILGSPEFQRR